MRELHPDIQRILLHKQLEQGDFGVVPAMSRQRDKEITETSDTDPGLFERTVRGIGNKAGQFFGGETRED